MTDTSNPGICWGGRSCGVQGGRCCQAPRRRLASTPVAGESAGSKTRRSKTQRASPQARPRNAAAFVATSDSRKITRCTSRYLLRVAGILAKQPAGGDARGSIDIENEERPKSTQAAEHTYGGGVHSSAAVCTTSQTETRANSKIPLTLADHYSTSVSTFRNVLSPPTVLPVAPRMPIPASSMVLRLIVFPPGTAKIANVVPVT